MKLWANTRWDSRWVAIDSIIRNYSAIITALTHIEEESTGARSTNAAATLVHVKRSIFILTSFILHELFGLVKVLSDLLKSMSSILSFFFRRRIFIFSKGPSLDYVRGENLIESLMQKLKDLRNEQSFHKIYEKAKALCDQNDINLVAIHRARRATTVPARFQNCFIDTTLGHRQTVSTSSDYFNHIYLPLIDSMLTELNDRFSAKTLSLIKSISTVYPESENFLNTEAIDDFCVHIAIDATELRNEFAVIKSMLRSKKVNDIIHFVNELKGLYDAFPQTVKMIKSAITMPISQVSCERSFSKMKIIKNYLRSSMSDQRLSDLTILAIERDIEINFDQVIDEFSAGHANRRILLR